MIKRIFNFFSELFSLSSDKGSRNSNFTYPVSEKLGNEMTLQSVNFEHLEPGTLVKAQTENTLYYFIITEDGTKVFDGGKRFHTFLPTKIAAINVGSPMVFLHPNYHHSCSARHLTTTPTVSLVVSEAKKGF